MAGDYAAVVGAVNMDIWGRSFAPLIARDSNPGEVRFSPGGVGHNIAHNMCLLDMKVQMLTAIGGDIWANQIEHSCLTAGIGLKYALHEANMRTSTYLFISGPDGDMQLAVCDTDIAKFISPEYIEANLKLLNDAALVVFDGNLTQDSIACLTEVCTAPLFADPVSVTKAQKLKPFLSRIHTIKPNALEAAALTGESSPEDAAKALVRAGVGNAFVSDGGRGMAVCCGERAVRVPCCRAELINATGGGDAAMAALCRSFYDGRRPEEAARYALAAGAIAVESEETISPKLSDSAVRERCGL